MHKQKILIMSYHVSEVWRKTIHDGGLFLGFWNLETIVVDLYYTPTLMEKQTKHTEKEITQKCNTRKKEIKWKDIPG